MGIADNDSYFHCIATERFEGALKDSVTLRCPVEATWDNKGLNRKLWYRGNDTSDHKMVAEMILHNSNVITNCTYGERSEYMWFSTIDGDLNIRNLSFEDAGLYTCHFSRYKHETIQLSVKGAFLFFNRLSSDYFEPRMVILWCQ